jgi:hypothetical protein
MNRRKMAAVLRQIAELDRRRAELTDEFADALAEDEQVQSQPRRRGGSPKVAVLPPEAEVDDTLKARARVLIASRGR